MFKKFAIASVLSCICAPAMACLPPPAGFLDWSSLQAVVSSFEVREKLEGMQVEKIELIKPWNYRVTAGMCSLQVEVKMTYPNPSAPCGGPMEFTAVPAVAVACTQ